MNKQESAMCLSTPKNAIILAAGFGMRMVPINRETPKALLEVNGETLVERLIRQLHEVGIYEICIVVGFMKESFAYLTEKYGVELIWNEDYATKNNLSSLAAAADKISNTYITPCDIWCDVNPFRKHERNSWYMMSNSSDSNSDVRMNDKKELMKVSDRQVGNRMIGISYLIDKDAAILRKRISQMVKQQEYDNSFWEEALYEENKMMICARVVSSEEVIEIDTYEQLRNLDSTSRQLQSEAMGVICQSLQCENSAITEITVLKKGMTNRSFLFKCNDKQYIMRIPGEGTDMLIDRLQEAAVYAVIGERNICDHVIYMNPQNGYKITEFIENARVCDAFNATDLGNCMARLRSFHNQQLEVAHTFDLFGQIAFYESLWGGAYSEYEDYKETKAQVFSLRKYIERYREKMVLTHIDAVPDNFLLTENEKGEVSVRLIDWEYAGMQDPNVDIAMFCIYALYDKKQVDHLIDIYFEGECSLAIRIKIYCYIAVCGLLWSNWCEYKRSLGVEFGEYSLRQYQYAKEYSELACEEMKKLENSMNTDMFRM